MRDVLPLLLLGCLFAERRWGRYGGRCNDSFCGYGYRNSCCGDYWGRPFRDRERCCSSYDRPYGGLFW